MASAGAGDRIWGRGEANQEGEGVGDCQDEGSARKSKRLQSRAGQKWTHPPTKVVPAKFSAHYQLKGAYLPYRFTRIKHSLCLNLVWFCLCAFGRMSSVCGGIKKVWTENGGGKRKSSLQRKRGRRRCWGRLAWSRSNAKSTSCPLKLAGRRQSLRGCLSKKLDFVFFSPHVFTLSNPYYLKGIVHP